VTRERLLRPVSAVVLAVQVGVFVVVPVVWGVPVPVVKEVQVIVVRNDAMAAAVAVDMVVFSRIVRPMALSIWGHGRSTPAENGDRWIPADHDAYVPVPGPALPTAVSG